MSRSTVVSARVLLAAALLAVTLFVAGAMWRSRVARGKHLGFSPRIVWTTFALNAGWTPPASSA